MKTSRQKERKKDWGIVQTGTEKEKKLGKIRKKKRAIFA